MFEEVEWRDIPGWEGYQMAEDGRVKRLESQTTHEPPKTLKEKEIKVLRQAAGGYQLGLRYEGKRFYVSATRLMARTWLRDPIDIENWVAVLKNPKGGFRASNVKWVERSSYYADMERNHAVTDHEEARAIRKYWEVSQASIAEVAAHFGLCVTTTRRILRHITWKNNDSK